MARDLSPHAGDAPLGPLADVLEGFWAGKSPRTVRAYRDDLLRIADWRGLSTIDELARTFLAARPGPANVFAEQFKGYALKKGWAPSYVNNHLAALRSLVRFARKAGKIVWALDVDDVPAERYTDTRGPGLEGMVATLRQARAALPPARAARDVAILALFAMRGLRRDEIVTLDLEHVDLAGERLLVKRKKKKQRVWVTIPPFCVAAVQAWLSFRGGVAGALFQSFAVARQREDKRLAESSVWWLVKHYALAAGVPAAQARPHGFRHAAVTAILDITQGNIRAAQLFADHSNPATTTVYDDNRKDVAGEVSRLLAKKIEEELGR